MRPINDAACHFPVKFEKRGVAFTARLFKGLGAYNAFKILVAYRIRSEATEPEEIR